MSATATTATTATTTGTALVRGPDAAVVRLRAGVRIIQRDGGQLMLVPAADDGRPVRLSAAVAHLLPLLVDGASPVRMVEALRIRFPDADVEPKVVAFIRQLASVGLVDGVDGGGDADRRRAAPAGPRRIRLFSPDPLARAGAAVVRLVPRSVLLAMLGIAVIVAITGVIRALAAGWSVTAVWYDARLVGAVWIVAHICAHELGHAVTSRYLGVPATSAGFLLGGRILPSPYVETPMAFTLRSRWERLAIPLAGPLVDVLGIGLAAWVSVLADGTLAATARFVAAVLLIGLVFNLNPLRASDGSHVLEALLDDDLARRGAVTRVPMGLSSPKTLQRYRRICLGYLVVFVAGIAWPVVEVIR